ncbi:MAG: hypothetical protein LBH43_10235 [Treponema sp.]|nr:hypothetical protein [Treponema sp.]
MPLHKPAIMRCAGYKVPSCHLAIDPALFYNSQIVSTPFPLAVNIPSDQEKLARKKPWTAALPRAFSAFK